MSDDYIASLKVSMLSMRAIGQTLPVVGAMPDDIWKERPTQLDYMEEYYLRLAEVNRLARRRDTLALVLPPHNIDFREAQQDWEHERREFVEWNATR